MVSIKDLGNDKRNIPVVFGGHVINVTYTPSTITDDFLDEHQTLGMAKSIADGVDAWDVVDDDGTPFPLEEKRLKTLPIAVLRRVWWEGVIKDNGSVGLPEVPAPSDAS